MRTFQCVTNLPAVGLCIYTSLCVRPFSYTMDDIRYKTWQSELSLNFCLLILVEKDFRIVSCVSHQSSSKQSAGIPGVSVPGDLGACLLSLHLPHRVIAAEGEGNAGRRPPGRHPGVCDQGVPAPQGGRPRPDPHIPQRPDHRPAGHQRRRENHCHVRLLSLLYNTGFDY